MTYKVSEEEIKCMVNSWKSSIYLNYVESHEKYGRDKFKSVSEEVFNKVYKFIDKIESKVLYRNEIDNREDSKDIFLSRYGAILGERHNISLEGKDYKSYWLEENFLKTLVG